VRKAIHRLPLAAVWVIDNLPDVRDQFEDLRAVAGHLRLMITPRDARPELLQELARSFPVAGLDPDAAVALLVAGRDDPKQDLALIPTIAAEVGYLPIALTALAARLGAGADPAAVLDELRSPVPADQKDIFSDAAGPIDRSDGVFNALNSALIDLANADPAARKRLAPFGYLADAPIPLGLAHALTGLDDPSFQAFLRSCRTRSIMAPDGSNLTVHALSSACIAAANPADALPRMLERVPPRQEEVGSGRVPSRIDADGKHYVQILVECRRHPQLGPEHADTLTVASTLATAYQNAGRVDEVISLHEATLDIMKRAQGPEHPNTLASLHNLGDAYRAAGRSADADRIDPD